MAHEFGLGNRSARRSPFGSPSSRSAPAACSASICSRRSASLVTYWAVFSLGRIVVGDRHAAMAVLLMAGIAAFSVPTPEFGPAILAMPLWALLLLHYWRAVGQGRRLYWLAAGLEAGLLLLTTYSGLVLIGLLIAFMLATRRGRAQFMSGEPLVAGAIVDAGVLSAPGLDRADRRLGGAGSRRRSRHRREPPDLGVDSSACLIAAMPGFSFWSRSGAALRCRRAAPRPKIERAAGRSRCAHVRLFLRAGARAAIGLLTLFTGRAEMFIAPPLVVLSGLAVIVAAADRIRIVHQRLTQYAWAALLLLPPLIVALAVTLLPWTLAVDLRVAQPAAEMGRFFAENFERRTGRPLAIVTGDGHTAALIALTAPSRPSLYSSPRPSFRRG